MERRYGALRIIALLFKALGILIGLFALLAGLGVCGLSAAGSAALQNAGRDFGMMGPFGVISGVVVGVLALLGGLLNALLLYATGEVISLLIALEENTRTTALLVQRQLAAPAAATAPVPVTAPAPPATV